MAHDLFELFRAAEVDPGELASILLGHFHGAMQPGPDDIVYPGEQTQYALKLTYGKDGLERVSPGPSLKDEDVDSIRRTIENDLLASAGEAIGTAVFFAAVPVDGCFRYRDLFQILPPPNDAPKPPFVLGDHPFRLQFKFPASSNWTIRVQRRATYARQLELLLGGLLEGSIHGIGSQAMNHWVFLPYHPGEEMKAAYCQEGYTAPNLDGISDAFSALTGISEMVRVQPELYYTRIGVRSGQQFEIPTNFEETLDNYSALPRETRERFLRACFWYQHANRVHSYSRSASFTALISAVEVLMPDEKSGAPCEACGRRQGKGSTQRFAEFIDRFAPSSQILSADRKRFYQIRSKLSHGGSLLRTDQFASTMGLDPSWTEDLHYLFAAWHLVRVVLVNWLNG